MSEQYTPNLAEMVHVQRALIDTLRDQIRDLQVDLALSQPRQIVGGIAAPRHTTVSPQDVTYMRNVERLTFVEIGMQLGISRQAAQKRYEKAKA